MSNGPEHPVVCALKGSEMGDRVAAWARLGRSAVVRRQPHSRGAVLEYRRSPNVETELRHLIGLERDCCSFLEFDLELQAERLVLTVAGPAEAAALIRQCWGIAEEPRNPVAAPMPRTASRTGSKHATTHVLSPTAAPTLTIETKRTRRKE